MGRRAYLDHAATTPMAPEARAAVLAWLGPPANPSGAHGTARAARRALEAARAEVAGALGAEPADVVFTGGGTEACNLAVHAAGGAVVCSAVEHHAVLRPVLAAGGRTVAVDAAGRVDLDALEAALDPEVALVSVMLANNETGVLQPLDAVAAVVRARAPRARLHTDAAHAAPWVDLAAATAGCDLVSLSAHKVGGPPGVGVLCARAGTPVPPLMLGGGQEHGRRPGTPDVPGAVGTAAALAATGARRQVAAAAVGARRDRLVAGLAAAVDGLHVTAPAGTVPGTAHVCIPGVDAEELLVLLDDGGVDASAGAACTSGALEPSHVLAAMGVDPALARGRLRLSLGATTTDAEVDRALEVIPAAVDRLRR